jgi:hypothetical protein
MEHAVAVISAWFYSGESIVVLAAGIVVAVSFLIFNTIRIALYVPQLRTCWKDVHGCPTINLWTWSSWIMANTSTGLYMWLFLNDSWGLILNLGNAAMCLATVVVTLVKRQGRAKHVEWDNRSVAYVPSAPADDDDLHPYPGNRA